MEAMAVGVPVVATDAGSQAEVVRDRENGWLVPTRDVPALLDAMLELADDAERARSFGLLGRETICTRFDPLTHATRLSDLLTDLHARDGAEESARLPGEARRQA
jgi:glycosyltransferase involved in cell wall biosynthesis